MKQFEKFAIGVMGTGLGMLYMWFWFMVHLTK